MGALSILQFILVIAQIGISIAIAVVVRQDLWYQIPGTAYNNCYYYWYGRTVCYGEWVCLMTESSTNICSYAWAVCAVSFGLSILLAIAQAGRGRYGRACLCSAVFAALVGLAWWIGGAVTFLVNSNNADDSGIKLLDDAHNDRVAVYAMAWTEVGLFFLSALVALADCKNPPKPQPQAQAYPTGAYVQQPPAYGAQPAYSTAPPPYAYPPPGAGGYSAPPPGYPVGAQYATPAYPPPAPGGYNPAPPTAYPPPGAAAGTPATDAKV